MLLLGVWLGVLLLVIGYIALDYCWYRSWDHRVSWLGLVVGLIVTGWSVGFLSHISVS